MTRRGRATWAALAGLVASAGLAAGCGGDPGRVPVYPARGTVRVQGEVPEGAFLVLHPKGAAAPAASPAGVEVPRPRAVVKADGSFLLSTYDDGDGAPAGDYVATLEWRPLVKQDGDAKRGPNVLPDELAQAGTSTLGVTIKASPNEIDPIVLERAGKGKKAARTARRGGPGSFD